MQQNAKNQDLELKTKSPKTNQWSMWNTPNTESSIDSEVSKKLTVNKNVTVNI